MKDFSSVIQYYSKSIAISQVVLGYIPQANQADFQQIVLGKGDLFRGEYLESEVKKTKNSHVNSWRCKSMPHLPTQSNQAEAKERKPPQAESASLTAGVGRRVVGKRITASILYT